MLLSIVQKVVKTWSFCGKQSLTLVLLSGHQFLQLFGFLFFKEIKVKFLPILGTCHLLHLSHLQLHIQKVHVILQEKLPTTMPLKKVQGCQKFSYVNISIAFKSPPRRPKKQNKIILRILLICFFSTLRSRKRLRILPAQQGNMDLPSVNYKIHPLQESSLMGICF